MANEAVLKKQPNEASKLEHFLYALYFFGQNIFYALGAQELSTYLANSYAGGVALSTTIIAATLIAPKIWDAVNDPLFGILIDKIHFKKGRFLPWLKISVFAIPITTLFMYLIPTGFPVGLKVAWVILGYVFWDTAYTICDAPIFALSTTMTSNVEERTVILSHGRFSGTLGIIITIVLIGIMWPPTAAQSNGLSSGLGLGWTLTALIFSVIGFLMMVPLCFVAKERCHAEIQKDPTAKDMWKALRKNKYLLYFLLGYFIYGFANVYSTASTFYGQYVLGDAAGKGTIMTLMGVLPMLILALFIPLLTKKIDKFHLYVGGLIWYIVFSTIQVFLPYSNFVLCCIFMGLRGIGLGFTAILVFMFTPDCVEYGEYHTGERNEGVAFSMQTLTTKLTSALVTSLGLLFLAWFGFKNDAATLANTDIFTSQGSVVILNQSTAAGVKASQAIWLVMTVISVIGPVISLPILYMYKLRDKDVQVMARYNNDQITIEEANKLLSAKYGPAAEHIHEKKPEEVEAKQEAPGQNS